jgi:hypothetical protein
MHRIKKLEKQIDDMRLKIRELEKCMNDEIVKFIKENNLFQITNWEKVYERDDELKLLANVSKEPNKIWSDMLQIGDYSGSFIYFKITDVDDITSFGIDFNNSNMTVSFNKDDFVHMINYFNIPQSIHTDFIKSEIERKRKWLKNTNQECNENIRKLELLL